jgi:tagatose-1,6-bisphosphate aldolase
VVEDLLLLGVLDGKAVFGSMNRGGLQGAAWEVDDRFTAYDAAAIEAMGFEGGKMLVRIDPDDPATAATVEACALAVSDLGARGLVAIVEPFMATRADGRVSNVLTTEAVIRASVIAAGLGTTSAYTWLKVPVVEDMERVIGATTLPTVLLGGEVSDDQDATFASWERALRVPGAIGLVVGRSLLYPPGDDVAGAVDAAVGLLPREVPA